MNTRNYINQKRTEQINISNALPNVNILGRKKTIPSHSYFCMNLSNFFLNKIFIYLFIYLWLCWAFVSVQGLSLVVVSGGYSSLQCPGFSLRWLLLLRSTGSRRVGFSSCGAWASVAPRHVGSSQTRALTRVPYIGRQILNHCATREAPNLSNF